MSATNVYPMFSVDKDTPESEVIVKSPSQRKLAFVEEELLATLGYIDEQLGEIDTKGKDMEHFNRGLYEVKKMFIEQKLNLLRQVAVLAQYTMKDENETGKSDDITSLLNA